MHQSNYSTTKDNTQNQDQKKVSIKDSFFKGKKNTKNSDMFASTNNKQTF